MKRNLFNTPLVPTLLSLALTTSVFANAAPGLITASDLANAARTTGLITAPNAVSDLITAAPAAANTADNFNSRPGIAIPAVKGYLQGNCWFFADFDVNRNGWAPHMEGDGAMVSGSGSLASENTGIYTPLLDLGVRTDVSFDYTFSLPVSDRRWIKICAADADDKNLFVLDSLELAG